tara:strand:- start:5709 stop:6395 length:687 start_codon:yes stop_codon:yes gene_type:complete
MKDQVIAIDGPSGSGKSTITKELASRLNITYLDTGAMFRSLGVILSEKNFVLINPSDEDLKEITVFLDSLDFQYAPSEDILIKINDTDYTDIIREHSVSKLASVVSKLNPVREYLAKMQREIAKQRVSILEGRDIGTVIFPNAALKIYLTASSDVRAKRRCDELKERGESFDFEQIKKDIELRDYEDMNRSIAPLKKADDAIEINSDNKSISQLTDEIIEHVKKTELF